MSSDTLSDRLRARACPAGEPWTLDDPAAYHGHTDCWYLHLAADQLEAKDAEIERLRTATKGEQGCQPST